MSIRRYVYLLVLGLNLLMASSLYANNLQITNVTLSNQNTTNHTYDINFHIYWENSWRDSGADGTTATEDKNWDAAWVFVKYSVYDESTSTWGPWHHASLDGSYYTVPNTCGGGSDACAEVKFGDTGGVYKGAFIYRSSYNEGSGTNDWDVSIRWKYGDDSVADDAKVRIKVFGIEMVFIPPGPFYVGDADGDVTNCFREGGTSHELYIDPSIDSDAGASGIDICVSDTNGCLYYDKDNDMAGDQSGPIPGTFPNGYDAFYVMKYNITNQMWAEFLNAITITQQQVNEFPYRSDAQHRQYVKLASNGRYGCDGNNNAGEGGEADYFLMNEANDGQWVVLSGFSTGQLLAFLDWAALRPWTELEFEKACRGPNPVVDDEFPWGNTTTYASPTALNNFNTKDEVPDQGNCNDDAAYGTYPYRAGCFANNSTTRESAGASFYGVMDLNNCGEMVITVGSGEGRAFTGLPGDGELAEDGSSNVSGWSAYGFGLRVGVKWGWVWLDHMRVADRAYGSKWDYYPGGVECGCGRGARTAP